MTEECTDDEWRAYWRLLQTKGLTSPGFVCRINLAHELGLLTPLLAGDLDTAEKLASEHIKSLSAQIRWVYPPQVSVPDEERSDDPMESWRQEAMAQDRAFVLSPEFVRLFRLAHHEGLLPAILRAAELDLPAEIPAPESKAWLPRFQGTR